jgi:predicted lipoprotein
MLKKNLKYIIATVIVGILGYNSIYTKKISDLNKENAAINFDPTAYSKTFLLEKFPTVKNKAIAYSDLIAALQTDAKKVISTNGHAQDQQDIKYFLVKGEGVVTGIDDEHVIIKDASGNEMKIATQFIFGNAARDCTGIISIDDFNNTMDLNNVSAEINKLIRTTVAGPFKEKVKKGDNVSFVGGLELNQSDIKTDKFEVIPMALEINAKKG